jgi:hypothetical protein
VNQLVSPLFRISVSPKLSLDAVERLEKTSTCLYREVNNKSVPASGYLDSEDMIFMQSLPSGAAVNALAKSLSVRCEDF